MSPKESLIVFGASGHAKSVIDTINAENRYRVVGLVDSFQKQGNEFFGYKIIGSEEGVPQAISQYKCQKLFVAVGDNFQRQAISHRLVEKIPSIQFVTIVHPSAIISSDAQLGSGVIVMPGAVINAGSVISDGCLVNTCSSIDHDSQLSDYSSVAPGGTIGGNVSIGARTSIGLGASVMQKITIGKDTVIGAGSVVVKDIEDSVVAYGSPCRTIRSRKPDEAYL